MTSGEFPSERGLLAKLTLPEDLPDVAFTFYRKLESQVVFRIKPSVRAAYRDHEDQVGASLISL
jgi:hypothetical protein